MNQNVANTGLAESNPYPFWFAAGLLCTSLAALLIRLYAAGDNFWLDEIIVYFLAMNEVHSLRDIFTGFNIEHHFLVTLEMWLAGDQLNWLWYRLPSVLAGTGMVVLSGIIAARRMRFGAAMAVSAATAVSFPLVVYSSEARGYVPAACFSLLAFLALDSWLAKRKKATLAAYWCAMITALLYHSTAICVFMALGICSTFREFTKNRSLMTAARNIILCHGPVLLAFGFLYTLVMRKWQTMGGDIQPLTKVISDTVSISMGFPTGNLLTSSILPVTLIFLAFTFWMNKGGMHSHTWAFYLTLLVFAPAIVLILSNRQFVYTRYFLVMFPFFYLMLGESLDKLVQGYPRLGVPVILLAACIIGGNFSLTLDFLRIGRGGYLEAVQYMAGKTPWPKITVSGDHDFRNETTLRFYSRYLPPGRQIAYIKQADWPAEGPDWSIIQSSCMETFTPDKTVQARGGTYRLMKSYPCSTLSGLNWHIYRNETKFTRKSMETNLP